ncbi:MAG: hypothetical protein JRH20_10910 [Deltaproteobacteria bacterium]|nr:hypothetical protein [Deltaproteobacteria bacterium]
MSAAFLVASLVVALVARDQTALRAAPEARAPRQAVLTQGDWLEVRGQRRDYLKVYDHRRERPGFVHHSRVRQHRLDAASAPALRAILLFLRDQRGSEALGIGYAALYLKAAPKSALDAEVFAALGKMSARLAWRASRTVSPRHGLTLAAHLEVARHYGIRFKSDTRGDRTHLCYVGDAFRRVLAQKASPRLHAEAALQLTNKRCEKRPPGMREKVSVLAWSLGVLERVDPTTVAPYVGNRLRLRRSNVAARLAYHWARLGELDKARTASKGAHRAFLRVDHGNLSRGDTKRYGQAALLVAANRWARGARAKAKTQTKTKRQTKTKTKTRSISLAVEKGEKAGQTCVVLRQRGQSKAVKRRCSYGLVWPSSIQLGPRSRQATIAVQHLPGWLELWVFRRVGDGWLVDSVVPAATDPQLGYVEWAGWTPGGRDLLVAREAYVEGRLVRRFAALRPANLTSRVQSRSLRHFVTFRRWHSAGWKAETLALR